MKNLMAVGPEYPFNCILAAKTYKLMTAYQRKKGKALGMSWAVTGLGMWGGGMVFAM